MKIIQGQAYKDSDDHAWLIVKKAGRGCWEAVSNGVFRNLTLNEIKQMTPQ